MRTISKEIVLKLITYLSDRDICNMSLTGTFFSWLCNDEHIFKLKYEREIGEYSKPAYKKRDIFCKPPGFPDGEHGLYKIVDAEPKRFVLKLEEGWTWKQIFIILYNTKKRMINDMCELMQISPTYNLRPTDGIHYSCYAVNRYKRIFPFGDNHYKTIFEHSVVDGSSENLHLKFDVICKKYMEITVEQMNLMHQIDLVNYKIKQGYQEAELSGPPDNRHFMFVIDGIIGWVSSKQSYVIICPYETIESMFFFYKKKLLKRFKRAEKKAVAREIVVRDYLFQAIEVSYEASDISLMMCDCSAASNKLMHVLYTCELKMITMNIVGKESRITMIRQPKWSKADDSCLHPECNAETVEGRYYNMFCRNHSKNNYKGTIYEDEYYDEAEMIESWQFDREKIRIQEFRNYLKRPNLGLPNFIEVMIRNRSGVMEKFVFTLLYCKVIGKVHQNGNNFDIR